MSSHAVDLAVYAQSSFLLLLFDCLVFCRNGVARNLRQGVLSSLPFPLSLFLFPFRPCIHLPLEVGPLNAAREPGECCKLPQWGLGLFPSGNRIWCILALKSDIWWHQFY